MPRDVCILIKSQLSRSYLDGLRERYGVDISVLNFSEVQSSAVLTQFRNLRKIAPDLLLIPVEDDNSRCVLPIMKLIAIATRAGRISVVDTDYAETSLSNFEAGWALGALIAATLASAFATLIASFEIRQLSRRRRHTAAATPIGRVLYVNANLWFGVKAGGSVGHISGVINALLGKGISVDFASCGTRLMARDSAAYIPLKAPKAFGVPFELNYYRFSRYVARLLGHNSDRHQYDAIYQRLSLANYSGVVLARKMKIPLITEYNGSEAWVAKNWGRPLRLHELASRAEDAMLKNSDVIVTVSDVLAAELVSRGISERRIVNYPNCIDPLMFDPARFSDESRVALRRQLDIAPDAIVATFVGTFGQWHGSDILATAIAQLVRTRFDWLKAHKVRFVLVGDGVKMPVVKRTLSEVDGADAFYRLVGLVPQADAPRYLAMSDILLSPHVENADGTSFFGSPTKLFEYMAMGKAIVASRLDQIAHVLAGSLEAANLPVPFDPSAGAVGVLCKPGSVNQLVEGICFCVENPEWRLKLGANTRARALARYTWQHHVDAILKGLDRINQTGSLHD
jgi:glycosyltransferase involved in cell wall biosynthesis